MNLQSAIGTKELENTYKYEKEKKRGGDVCRKGERQKYLVDTENHSVSSRKIMLLPACSALGL